MKKKFSVLIVCAFMLLFAKAQKGSILVGGSFEVLSTKTTSTSSSSTQNQSTFLLEPTIGYQIDKHWTVGGIAEIGTNKTSDNYAFGSRSSETEKLFAIGPFVRYAYKLSDIFYVYGQLQGLFGTDKTSYSPSTSPDDKLTATDIQLFPAVFVNLKNGFGLNFNIGGVEYETENDNQSSTKTTNFAITLGQNITIGVSKNFGGRK